MDLGLDGKSVVVTGAGAGIGLATVKLFAAEGARVVGADLDVESLQGIDAGPGEIRPLQADLSTADGATKAIQGTVDAFGRIDVLVNNVGIGPTREGFLDISDDEWQRVFTLNFFSMVRCARAALPHMVEQRSGALVHLGSEVARQPDVFLGDYSVSKAAVLSLSKILSLEFGEHGIRSNVVAPGPTRTALWEKPGGFMDFLAESYGMDREAAVDHFAKEVRKLPLGRIGAPEDVAAAIVFLASDRCRQVTGSVYSVDSGVMKAA
jgi:NAD(P)-dependent dehydrogenase (short-subunit alcohol dehydrogenase family)